MATTETLLYDTGNLPLWVRLPTVLAGVFALWLSAHLVSSHLFGYDLGLPTTGESGSPLLGFIVTLGLGGFFVSVWFLRNRIVFDSKQCQIVVHHFGLFGQSQRKIPLDGAKGVYVRPGRVRASRFWDLGIEFTDGSRRWLTRVYNGAEATARVFSERTGLPLVSN